MTVGGTRAPIDQGLAESGYDYEQFARLAGPLTRPDPGKPYRVEYRGISHSRREWLMTRLIALVLVALDVGFMYWLVFQSQYPDLGGWLWQVSWRAIRTDAYLMLLAGMAAGSLRAAKAIVYGGQLDVWLLDEGDSGEVKDMCQRLGVRHFTRKGRGYLEFDSGTFAAKTKQGNHNRWLWEHAGEYDIVMFVDTDHVPLPIMAERLLGYFRDPDVAFVVARSFTGTSRTGSPAGRSRPSTCSTALSNGRATAADARCSSAPMWPFLIAGGTLRYENLKPVYAGGSMTVVNNDTAQPVTRPKGTVFVAPDGAKFATALAMTVPAATKKAGANGKPIIVSAEQNIWVNATGKGSPSTLSQRPATRSPNSAQARSVVPRGMGWLPKPSVYPPSGEAVEVAEGRLRHAVPRRALPAGRLTPLRL